MLMLISQSSVFADMQSSRELPALHSISLEILVPMQHVYITLDCEEKPLR
jgi:hypothetical protein